MNWIEDKIIWVLSAFGAAIFGGVFSYGRLHQRVGQLENDKSEIKDNIKDIEEDLSNIKSKQDEMIGYAKAMDKKLDQILAK